MSKQIITFSANNIIADHLTAVKSAAINPKIVSLGLNNFTANNVTAVNLTASTVT